MFQPRYAPRRARLRISATRTVTSAAVLAALALVCGPALERTGEPAAAAAAAIRIPGQQGASGSPAATAPATSWDGALAIRPSKFAKAPAAAIKDAALVQPAPVGPPGEVGALGIPLMVLQAYHSAANRLGQDEASCKLPWWLLAGIGHTESGHAESGRLTADGTTRGRILGPRLDGGIAGDAVITDTDHGVLDGDKVYDRAVGPMQFIPSTWRHWGVDGNGDGKADPNNIFDATLAAGRYLCADGRDLSTDAGRQAAVLSYNYSPVYLATVLAWGEAYRDGASSVPDSLLPVVSDVTKVRPPRTARPPKPVVKPGTSPSGVPSGPVSSSRPAPSGSASASGSSSAGSSASQTATASATPTCTPGSPGTSSSATDSASSSVAVQPASGQSHTAPQSGATADGSATATADGSATASSRQSATGQAATGQSATDQSSPQESSSASTSAPASCAP